MASLAKQKQLRELMEKAKSHQLTGPTAPRVADKLAKYDAEGKLSCAICKMSVQEGEWNVHVASKKHVQVRAVHAFIYCIDFVAIRTDRSLHPSILPADSTCSIPFHSTSFVPVSVVGWIVFTPHSHVSISSPTESNDTHAGGVEAVKKHAIQSHTTTMEWGHNGYRR